MPNKKKKNGINAGLALYKARQERARGRVTFTVEFEMPVADAPKLSKIIDGVPQGVIAKVVDADRPRTHPGTPTK